MTDIKPEHPDVEKHPESISSAKDGSTELTARVVDVAAERALCRRFDYRLLPVLAVMYLFNAYVATHINKKNIFIEYAN